MRRTLLVLALVALLTVPLLAQGRETKPTFCPTIETYSLNSYTTIYRIQDSDVVCYWVEGFQAFGLSCLVHEKEFPPLGTGYSPIVAGGYKSTP